MKFCEKENMEEEMEARAKSHVKKVREKQRNLEELAVSYDELSSYNQLRKYRWKEAAWKARREQDMLKEHLLQLANEI